MSVEVVGVSTDPVDVNRRLAEMYKFKFRLVSDVSDFISRAYGVLGVDSFTVERVTFIVDPEGVIRVVLSGIRLAERRADEALKIVESLVTGDA